VPSPRRKPHKPQLKPSIPLVAIDTNVLLHGKFFDEVPWNALVGHPACALTIALPVVDELDQHKWSGDRGRRDRAEKILARLAKLNDGAELRQGVALRRLKRPNMKAFPDLDPKSMDDRIIASLKSLAKSAAIVLFTFDHGMKARGGEWGIDCRFLDEKWRLPPEPDPVERKLAAAQVELARLKNRQPDLALLLDGGLLPDRTRKAVSLKLVSAIQPHSPQAIKAQVEYMALRQVGKAVTDEDHEGSDWQSHFGVSSADQLSEFGRHLKHAYESQELRGRSFLVNSFLCNQGTAAATHVRLKMTLPAGVAARIDWPFQPGTDKPRDDFSIVGQTVLFETPRVGHNVPYDVPLFRITVPRKAFGLDRIEVPWEMNLEESPEPITGKLLFLLSWSEGMVDLANEEVQVTRL